MTTHLRQQGAHPQHTTLLIYRPLCGSEDDDFLSADGRDVDCDACKRAWEGVARPVTNIELAEALQRIHEALTVQAVFTTPLASTLLAIAEIREKLLAPSRKWPFS